MPYPVKVTDLRIPSAGDFLLACTLFEPDPFLSAHTNPTLESNAPIMMIASATAVLQTFYYRFALHFAKKGLAVITFDYRGFGKSIPDTNNGKHPLLDVAQVKVVDWAVDADAVAAFMLNRYPNRPLVYVGNSVGGHLIAMMSFRDQIARNLLVGVANPYWKLTRVPFKVVLLYQILAPALVPMFGYFPAKRFGIFEDVPASVMRQWGRWTTEREYMCSERKIKEIYATPYRQPVFSLSFIDDGYSGPASHKDFLRLWSGATNVWLHVFRAEQVRDLSDGKGIGHFNFFVTPKAWDYVEGYILTGETDAKDLYERTWSRL